MRKQSALLTIAAVSTAVAALTIGSFSIAAQTAESPAPARAATVKPQANTGKSAGSAPQTAWNVNNADEPDPDHNCGEVGPYQKDVEEDLDALGDYGTVFVDGKQSVEDCKAIKKFQKRMGIEPDMGYAGEVTKGVTDRLTKSSHDKCEAASKGNTVCVDLTHQTLWVLDSNGERIFDTTVVRTGMKGYATTPGSYEVNVRETKHWSNPYEVWLPYWQHFNDGQGLHQTTTYLHDPSIGSHGCVNLLPGDAEEVYQMLEYNDTVKVFGERPGT